MGRRPFALAGAVVTAVAATVPPGRPPEARGPVLRDRANLVLVLADDLSTDLVRFMPTVRRMQRRGASFDHYVVTDSLCCTSRASILTGEYPHNHGVLGNTGVAGGWRAFRASGAEERSVAVAIRGAGYRTGLFGKYLNGYFSYRRVPPGWTDWLVPGRAYRGFDYGASDDGAVRRYGRRPRDYATDVIRRRGLRFIRDAARKHQPFLAVLAPFTPHPPAAAAPRHRRLFERAYDTDVRVPLVVVGPGVPAGARVGAPAANVDLAPTVRDMAGVPPAPTADGRSLLTLAQRRRGAASGWRRSVLLEHRHTPVDPSDPDRQTAREGLFPEYEALRSRTGTYVRYRSGEREFFDRVSDPWQLRNRVRELPGAEIGRLDAALDAYAACRGALECDAAGRVRLPRLRRPQRDADVRP